MTAVATLSPSPVSEATTPAETGVALVKRTASLALDARADTRTIKPFLLANGRVGLDSPAGPLYPTDLALDQLAEVHGVPAQYARRMRASQPQLFVANLRTWMESEPTTRLWRMLREPVSVEHRSLFEGITQNGHILRAVLGASYRPLDNAELLDSITEPLTSRGASLQTIELNDRRLYARFVTMQARTIQQGAQVGDVIRAGVFVRNSETGFSSLEVSPFIEVVKCLNGMVVDYGQSRQRHVGRRTEVEHGSMQFSQQAERLDAAAFFAKVRDTALAALDDVQGGKLDQQLLAARTGAFEAPKGEPMFEFVGRIGAAVGLNEDERKVLSTELEHSIVEEGGSTSWAVAQAFTATARSVQDEDRRVAMQRAGWDIVSGRTQQLLKAGEGR